MPIGAQPRGARGTVERPYSALNLRLVLASFGLVGCVVLAVVWFRLGYPLPGVLVAFCGVIALVDIVVIQLRRRKRRRTDPERHSLFE